MSKITTRLDYIVAENRSRAVNRTVVKGGAEGESLAKAAAAMTGNVYQGMTELNGVMKPKFVLGLHPVDQSGRYVIP